MTGIRRILGGRINALVLGDLLKIQAPAAAGLAIGFMDPGTLIANPGFAQWFLGFCAVLFYPFTFFVFSHMVYNMGRRKRALLRTVDSMAVMFLLIEVIFFTYAMNELILRISIDIA